MTGEIIPQIACKGNLRQSRRARLMLVRWAAALKEKSMRIIRWIACVSVLSAVLMWPHSYTTAQTAALHDLNAFIARALQEYQVPGAAIAVVQDGTTVMAKGYGVRDVTKPGAVDERAGRLHVGAAIPNIIFLEDRNERLDDTHGHC